MHGKLGISWSTFNIHTDICKCKISNYQTLKSNQYFHRLDKHNVCTGKVFERITIAFDFARIYMWAKFNEINDFEKKIIQIHLDGLWDLLLLKLVFLHVNNHIAIFFRGTKFFCRS